MNNETSAVVMTRYGPPEVLTWARVALPPLGSHEVRIRTLASAVNHTDLEIRAGHWPIRKTPPFPYVPGVEVVGDIAEVGDAVTALVPGTRVVTMMQGMGGVRAERPGGYAELVTVNADAVAIAPAAIAAADLAAIGLVGVTAYEGLKRIGPLAGKRILVTGAAGGIGSLATAIAHAQGATVVGVVSRPEQAEYVRSLGAAETLVISRDAPRLEIKPGSLDGVLDSVGGRLFDSCVQALRPGGVLSLVGAVDGGRVTFDLWPLIWPVTLTGYSSETLDGTALRDAINTLADLFLSGALKPPRQTRMPLSEAHRAHAHLEAGGVKGRVLLIP